MGNGGGGEGGRLIESFDEFRARLNRKLILHSRR